VVSSPKKERKSGSRHPRKVTPVSLGYPISVFNKNSTLKERKKAPERKKERQTDSTERPNNGCNTTRSEYVGNSQDQSEAWIQIVIVFSFLGVVSKPKKKRKKERDEWLGF